jgi:endonuclease/exonuclease/phosphatase family metal-dependent hydrolase
MRSSRWVPVSLTLLLFGLLLTWTRAGCGHAPLATTAEEAATDSYLFCFWNVENLFDDRLDDRSGPDREYDIWFARDTEARQLKFAHLSEALLKLNDGKGPDILAVAEVESLRAAELLREALNRRLADPALHYTHVLMKELAAGRHIAPAILTRLPVQGDRTQLHGRRQRILEGHIKVHGHDLVVLASHWTSRVSDKEGIGRDHYGDQVYGVFRAMYKSNPKVDLLVCGDFNDPPDAESVTEHLHATGDIQAVRTGNGSHLLNLFAEKEIAKGVGTHYYSGHWYLFDQLVVSPGLLDDQGWSCVPKSARIVSSLVRPGDRQQRPWRFGNEHDRSERGFSDHFPVTVRLSVQRGEF